MFINDTILTQIKKDIADWSINFVESSNEFYENKFPVCPYARKAKLQGESCISIYQGGSVKNFIKTEINNLLDQKKHKVMLLIFPPITKWIPGIHRFVININKKIIPKDFYALAGIAVNTQSSYPGWFNSGPYFIIGVNTLSAVLPAVESLKSVGYYKNWSDKHYKSVVVRRQQMYEKYKGN
jgi:hypothetical protein